MLCGRTRVLDEDHLRMRTNAPCEGRSARRRAETEELHHARRVAAVEGRTPVPDRNAGHSGRRLSRAPTVDRSENADYLYGKRRGVGSIRESAF